MKFHSLALSNKKNAILQLYFNFRVLFLIRIIIRRTFFKARNEIELLLLQYLLTARNFFILVSLFIFQPSWELLMAGS